MARSEPGAIRITSAGTSPQADLARRQRRYLISMSIRSLCFIGAVIAGLNGITWLWPILIGGALILPYVAVVLANAGDTRSSEIGLVTGLSAYRELDEGARPEGNDDDGA